jgi:demethylmenaquinone methyltransferase / 2-methoxy-6-polyprenyl-1,4-benzoquinol methylase
MTRVVPPEQPPQASTRTADAVRAMFNRVAARYDLANHLLSGGVDFLWRARAAKIVASWRCERILDLATGSGDLALAVQRRMPDAEITGADFSEEMLKIARHKGLQRTVLTDALATPFSDGAFGCVTIAFGLRNMSDWARALREIARVLETRGRVLILDFSIPREPLRPAYRLYLHRCLPTLAGLVTGQRDAYRYLGASIEEFPSGAAMIDLLEQNGFRSAQALPLTGGIATIYTAEKRA